MRLSQPLTLSLGRRTRTQTPRQALFSSASLYWEAADSDGSTWVDRNASESIALTAVTKVAAGATYDTDKVAAADLLFFNGSSSFGALPDAVKLPADVDDDLTILLWGRTFTVAAEQRYVDTRLTAGQMIYSASGTTSLIALSTGTDGSKTSGKTWTVGRQTFGLRMDATGLRAVVAGTLPGSATTRSTGNDSPVVTTPTLGKRNNESSAYAKMALEGLAFWPRALTTDEIALVLPS